MNADQPKFPPVVPPEGLHVLHLFYRVDNTAWDMLDNEEQLEARTRLLSVIKEARELESTQLLTFCIVTPKADVGFMLLTPDLQAANQIEKKLSISLGPDVLLPTFSYLSMTERSEYTTSEDDHATTLKEEKNLAPGSAEFDAAMEEFRDRIGKYARHRLYPNLPDWPVACFYPMAKRRSGADNWYVLPFEQRKKLMAGHARVGRTYSGRILQLITGSTGLDEMEWGVTLFAKNTHDIKAIVYEMRFDEVSARYADFGDFFIGLQVPLDEIFTRLHL